jgi:hypothetical protein
LIIVSEPVKCLRYVVQEKNIFWCLTVPFVYIWHTRWISSHCFIVTNTHKPSKRCWQKVPNRKQRLIAMYIIKYVELSFLGYSSPFPMCRECQNSKNQVINVEWEITVSQKFWITTGTHFFWHLILSILASLASYCYFSTLLHRLVL